MEFSRWEYWVGNLSLLQGIFPTQGLNAGLTLQADYLPAEPQGKPQNTGVGSLSLLQCIFLTQELNWGLLHCRWILYQLSYEGRQSHIYILTWQFFFLNWLSEFNHLCQFYTAFQTDQNLSLSVTPFQRSSASRSNAWWSEVKLM